MFKVEGSPSGVLTIAAGPVYVEFRTKMTYAPTSNTHTELVHHKDKWEPHIGGSVWKAALYSKQRAADGDKFVLVSRFAKEHASASNLTLPKHPFIDDAHWLKASIRREVDGDWVSDKTRVSTEKLEVVFKQASAKALTDYTFHMEHPTWQPWPVLTIRGGAAIELSWQDVVDEWKNQTREGQGNHKETIVLLTGVLRTRLLETLSEAIKRHDDDTTGEAGLLNRAKLVIDFGRTARNVQGPALTGKTAVQFLKYVRIVQNCVRHAQVVLADEHTAEEFELRRCEHLPECRLVIRRAMIGSRENRDENKADNAQRLKNTNEIWWQYRRADKKPAVKAQVMYGHFDAPQTNESHADEKEGKQKKTGKKQSGNDRSSQVALDNRPARDMIVARSLCLKESAFEPKTWGRYLHTQRPQTPEEITNSDKLRRDLQGLRDLVAMEAISTLFIYGETGTGKEVVSRWIHDIHPTFSNGNFHALSCGRQRGDLVQSELFGHVKGAFNEALKRDGAFVSASGGVLLLDDLDSLDETTQAMLLRVIENGLVLPVGGDAVQPVHLFLIATTNVDPKELMRRRHESDKGEGPGLREDLYYRFLHNGEVLFLPPLRNRREDIISSAKIMWDQQNQNFAQNYSFPKALETAVQASDLVGNYRTLSAAVAKTFRATLTGHPIPGSGIKELPPMVKEWLNELADDGPMADSQLSAKVESSNLLTWLLQKGFRDKLKDHDLEQSVKQFLELWKQAREDDVGVEEELSLGQIDECVGKRNTAKLRLELKKGGILPSTGRTATWKLAKANDTGAAIADSNSSRH